jgi:tyrosine-protein kinase Etk/Wzc
MKIEENPQKADTANPYPEVPDLPPDLHLMDYLLVLLRHKWGVISTFLISSVLFVAITFYVPYSYESKSVFLPPDRASSAGMLAAEHASGALKILKAVENPSVDLLQNLLESRAMSSKLAKDSIIRRFYSKFSVDDEMMDAAIRSSILVTPSISNVLVTGTVTTGWFSTQSEKEEARHLSAYLVNMAVHNMDSMFSSEFKADVYLSHRYADSDYAARNRELDSLDVVQEQFEREHGTVSLKEQTLATINQLAALQATRDEAEIKANIFRRDLSESDPNTAAAVAESEEASRAARDYVTEAQIGPSLAELPEVSRQYAEIIRRKAALEPIVAYLKQEAEQQRINEERTISLVTVVDIAKAPERKSSPKRLPMLMLGMTVGLALAIFYAALRAFLESWEKEKMSRSIINNHSDSAGGAIYGAIEGISH